MRVIGIVTSLVLLAVVPAAAVEPEAFLERLGAAYAFMGYELEFGPARAEGDAIVVEGVTVAVTRPEGLFDPVNLDVDLRFEGVAETADGTYTAETLSMERIAFENDTGFELLGFSVEDVRMSGFYLPPGDVRTIDTLTLFSDLETGPMRFTQNGADVFSISAVRTISRFNPPPGTGALVDLSSHIVVEGVTIHTGLEKDSAKTGIAIFGASTVDGRLEGLLTWTIERGRVSVEKLRFAFDEQGALDLAFAIEGMTPDVMEMIYETERRAAEMRSKGKTQSADEIEMQAGLELIDNLHFVSASIRYDDATLVERLLAHLARQEGLDTPAYTEGLLEQLSLTLSHARAPGLADSIVGQVRQFLADPESIQITAAPVSPLRLITVVSAAVNPAGLANMLGLSVTTGGGDANNDADT